MGVKSTMDIMREDAIREILTHIMNASDHEIEEILEDLVGERLFLNFTVVSEYKLNTECRSSCDSREYYPGRLD